MATKEQALEAIGKYKGALGEARELGSQAFGVFDEWHGVISVSGLSETAALIFAAKDHVSISLSTLDGALAEAEQTESDAHQAN